MSTTPSDNNQANQPQMTPEVQGTHLFMQGLAQRYDAAVRELGGLRFGLEASLNLRSSPEDVMAFMAQVRNVENTCRALGEGLMMLQFQMRTGHLQKYIEWRNAGAVPPPAPPGSGAMEGGGEGSQSEPAEEQAEKPKTVDDL